MPSPLRPDPAGRLAVPGSGTGHRGRTGGAGRLDDGTGEVLAVNDLDSYARFRAQLPAGANVILLGRG